MGELALGPLIEAFLAADGFTVERPAAHCFAATRVGEGGQAETCYVWFRDPEHGIDPSVQSLVTDFEMAKPEVAGGAAAFLVTPVMTGISNELRQAASAARVGIRVPVQFFDTAYRVRDGQAIGAGRGRAASQRLRAVLREGEQVAALRVPQPFDALSALGAATGGFGTGGDLLEHLVATLESPAGKPRLSVVLGAAGAGKTFLVTSLFAALQERFLAAKLAQRMARRPVLFQPDMIRERLSPRIDTLLQAVAETEVVAGATRPPLMRFLNRAGFTTWIFDGLDEFFAGEGDFVAELDEALGSGGPAEIVLATRGSLMTSSSALRGLVDRHIGSGAVALYELAGWERPSHRGLAYLRRVGRLPTSADTTDPAPVARFLESLERSETRRQLARLPFYANLLLDLEAANDEAIADELDLLAVVVDRLIDREAGKLASGELGFGWDVFSGAETFVEMVQLVEASGAARFADAGERARIFDALGQIGRERLVELIETLAHAMRMTEPYPNEGGGLSTEEIEDLASVYIDVGLAPELEPRVLLALVQLAFFGPGGEEGHVRFAHEIVADYLAARHAMRLIRGGAESGEGIAQALGVRRDLEGGVVLGYLVRQLSGEPDLAAKVRAHIEGGRVRERGVDGAKALLAAMQAAGI